MRSASSASATSSSIGRRPEPRAALLRDQTRHRAGGELLALCRRTIDEARTLSERKVPVIAITDSAFSPLVQFATIWFEVAEADFGGFRTLSATMALAMALAVGIGRRPRDGRGDAKAGA